MTIKDLRKWISGAIIIYRPLEKAPYWKAVRVVDSIYDLEDDLDGLIVHHIEAGYDHWNDPCIGIYLDIDEEE